MEKISTMRILLLTITSVLFVACSQEPAEIHYGSDECVHCKMMITDNQFASQLVTEKGKAYKFDAIECMVAYRQQNQEELSGALFYVSNYDQPGQWLNAREAQFVKSEVVRSPMGESLLAFPSKAEAENHVSEKPGNLLTWQEVSRIQL
ncbi:nitrous oxide reductase accessory protein NosL [Fodinibius sediminis]|uniref:Copper chaperone NosL n=1 Tax=Fodinibius sediminis TaxID=1214077 RepID=A0A521BM53_9BACT|nr:nitrous oxide reductase accessory protein NosL [Fodinibius sediminis]SMO48228.1 copper chaperone NosL [Fodinibius sediminis]